MSSCAASAISAAFNTYTGPNAPLLKYCPSPNSAACVLPWPNVVQAKEVIGGYAVFELRDKEEALASAKEFMQLHSDLFPEWEGVCELRAIASGAG